MLHASWVKYTLDFRFLAKTSRDSLRQKETWFLFLKDKAGTIGIGECSILKGISPDNPTTFEKNLNILCHSINSGSKIVISDAFPAIQFGYEMALRDLKMGGNRLLFSSSFTKEKQGVLINGLVWMGNFENMLQQIQEKLDFGYSVIKLKIGAIDFNQELKLLSKIRDHYSVEEIKICVDANGAFSLKEAQSKLDKLAKYDIHSIEQPIKAGNWRAMQKLCKNTPLPIALDEELIGITERKKKKELLQIINPQYIILKPSLLGGFAKSQEWINYADNQNIGWWITSLLESNIGLNAIAQWSATLDLQGHQGLGTGQLYTNNFPSPLKIKKGYLYYSEEGKWDLNLLNK